MTVYRPKSRFQGMRHLIPVVLLFAAGCASPSGVHWMTEDVHPVAVGGDRRLDRVRIWTGDSVLQWHTVLVTRDSISGILTNVSQPCDSCRLTLPTSAVDSLQVGYTHSPYADTHSPPKPLDFVLFLILVVL